MNIAEKIGFGKVKVGIKYLSKNLSPDFIFSLEKLYVLYDMIKISRPWACSLIGKIPPCKDGVAGSSPVGSTTETLSL